MPSDLDFIVRKLSPVGRERVEDLRGVKALCSDRSYMGKDIAEVFSYRDLWADLIIDPYVEFSSDFLWVAQAREKGEILGYLTGAIGEDFYARQDRFVGGYIDKLSKKGLLNIFHNPMKFWGDAAAVLSGLNHRTIEFLRYLKTQARNEIPDRPPTPHFNVFARYDNCGIARALIGAYLQELKRRSIPRFHITALYVPGERMRWELERKGFRVRSLEFFQSHYSVHDAVLTSVFSPYAVMIGCFERKVPQILPPSPVYRDSSNTG